MKLTRFFFAVLAIAALSVGCSDLPTSVEGPQPPTASADEVDNCPRVGGPHQCQ